MNTKKRKTGKGHCLCLPNLRLIHSQSNIYPTSKNNTRQESLVGEILLEILGKAERFVDIQELSLNHSLMMIQKA